MPSTIRVLLLAGFFARVAMKIRSIFLSGIASLAAVFVLSMSAGVHALPLLMDSGPIYGTGLEGVGGPFYSVVVQPFTLNVEVANVEVDALLYPGSFPGVSSAKVSLTTQVGPGTTAAHVIATQIVPGAPYSTPIWMNIMAVSSLSAGDYYLVMQPEVFDGESSYWWQTPLKRSRGRLSLTLRSR